MAEEEEEEEEESSSHLLCHSHVGVEYLLHKRHHPMSPYMRMIWNPKNPNQVVGAGRVLVRVVLVVAERLLGRLHLVVVAARIVVERVAHAVVQGAGLGTQHRVEVCVSRLRVDQRLVARVGCRGQRGQVVRSGGRPRTMVAALRLLVHQVRSVVEAAAQVLPGRLHRGFVLLLADVGAGGPVGVGGGQPLVVRQAHRVSRVGRRKPLQVFVVVPWCILSESGCMSGLDGKELFLGIY
ncbi:hypothetical protein EYF80_000361 [Liparis tanakae]|uniref:Uncharacterized protein n=1 Tax=Liparis tanakae TaxID=230148 RepID=A0A4Z2JGT2_9TELE|nr:hypothetical protein EYF80_000361 [Liparis tanakae]